MAPDAVRTADVRLLPADAHPEVRGATAVAEETTTFRDRIASAVPVLIAGHPGAVIAPGGHAYALVHFRIHTGLVTEIRIAPYVRGTVSVPGTA